MNTRLFLLIAIMLLLFPSVPVLTNTSFAQAPPAAVEKVPVIILFDHKPTIEDEDRIESEGGEIKRVYDIMNGFAAEVPEDKIDDIESDSSVISVDPDVDVHALGLASSKQIRADQVWAEGDTGTGVPVAILDTGIDMAHPEFAGRILKCHSEITMTDTCIDLNGHGSHVAGIAGSAGSVNINSRGVGPSISLYIDQVLDATGSGSLSGVIAGIDWAKANGAKVISMSLGTSFTTTSPNCDSAFQSLTNAVNNAVAAGISVVAAAGNSGSTGVSAPGCISSTIVVGAVSSTDTIASFSSRGGAMEDHGIVAPGVSIYSTSNLGSFGIVTSIGSYGTMSGTSMATPHVAGTIALLLQADAGLTPSAIKSNLFSSTCTQSTTSSCPTGTVPNNTYGHGRVDALSAYNAVVGVP